MISPSKMLRVLCIVCLILDVSRFVVCNDCVGLPSDSNLTLALESLVKALGEDPYSKVDTVNMTEDPFYTCLAQGTSDGTYRKLSVITTFNTNLSRSPETRQFEMQCLSNEWSGVSDSLTNPGELPAIIGLRKDFSNCTRTAHNENHCLREVQPVAGGNLLQNKNCTFSFHAACNAACNTGLRRCTDGGIGDCCAAFKNDMCINRNCTQLNFVTSEQNNFKFTCSGKKEFSV